MEYQQYFVRDPKICGGEPVVKGTRVTVRTILASLTEGATIQEILADFPTLTEGDVRAVRLLDVANLDQRRGHAGEHIA